MKKDLFVKICAVCAAAVMMAGCGDTDDVKTIDSGSAKTETVAADQGNAGDAGSAAVATTSVAAGGYVYSASYNGATVDVVCDAPAASVLDALGEPKQYFEAKSCAFEGLDKTYTYDHFEITTYPNGDTDMISSVFLLDDMVTTKEGLYVGASKEDMESKYGTDYTVNGDECVYAKDNMKLHIIVTDGVVKSITYASSAAEEQ